MRVIDKIRPIVHAVVVTDDGAVIVTWVYTNFYGIPTFLVIVLLFD